jgi:hypothetical protein
MTPCVPLKFDRCLGGIYRLHHQCLRISQGTATEANQRKQCFHAGFFLGIFFNPKDGNDMFIRNVGWIFNGLHSVISQRQVTTAVRISNRTSPLFVQPF